MTVKVPQIILNIAYIAVGLGMEGTRFRILQLLQSNGNQAVEALASNIGLAPATIRRHLDILQRDRYVDFREVRKKTGRPEYSFFLTEEGQESLPKNYDRLLADTVDKLARLSAEDIDGRDGEQVLELVFESLSHEVFSQHEGEIKGKSFSERTEILLNVLEEKEFFPEIELAGSEMRLKLKNCPYRFVALQNQAVCSFDSNIVSAFLSEDVKRPECITSGSAHCIYSINIHNSDIEGIAALAAK